MNNKYRILITGGAGFIGSNLTEYFLGKGHHVRCLDNFATGHLYNIEPFLENDRYELIEGDIRNPEDCKRAVGDGLCVTPSSIGQCASVDKRSSDE